MSEDLLSEIHEDADKYTVSLPEANLPQFLKKIKERLEERIIGQPRPIKRIIRGITTFYACLNDPKRPIGVFMFAGPSGSGKTYLAEELAYALLGEPEGKLSPLVKIDCGSLSLGHTVASLTGSPPGYVGYGDQVNLEMVGEYDRAKRGLTQLEQKCRELVKKLAKELAEHKFADRIVKEYTGEFGESLTRLRNQIEKRCKPFRSVVLFDEIEKADMNVQSQLLRILDEGKLDLLNGRQVDMRGSVIILTTNVGTEQILSEHLNEEKIGFSLPHKETIEKAKNLDESIYRRVWKEIFDRKKRYFKPELLARIGKPGIIVFHVLSYQDYQKILELRLRELQNLFIKEDGPGALLVSYTQEFKDFLIEEGVSPVFGARALCSVIDKYVRTPIAEKILQGQLKVGDKILLNVKFKEGDEGKKEGYTVISRRKRPAGVTLPDFKARAVDVDFTSKFDEISDKFLADYLNEINAYLLKRG